MLYCKVDQYVYYGGHKRRERETEKMGQKTSQSSEGKGIQFQQVQ